MIRWCGASTRHGPSCRRDEGQCGHFGLTPYTCVTPVGGFQRGAIVKQSPNPQYADFDFLRTELRTGRTFSRLARSSRDEHKKNRNRANARKAYDAVVHFGRGANLLPDQESEIRTELEVLKAELQQLGEQI